MKNPNEHEFGHERVKTASPATRDENVRDGMDK
jgi:hypothetical protein